MKSTPPISERIAELTGPEAGGGSGMSYAVALQKMRETPADAALIGAMGAAGETARA